MIHIGPLKIPKKIYLTILSGLFALLIIIVAITFIQSSHQTGSPHPVGTKGHKGTPTTAAIPTTGAVVNGPIKPTPPGNPTLTTLQQATNQAFGHNDQNVPNSWGVQKNRIVRTSTGDLFTVYISSGPSANPYDDLHDRIWHLIHLAPGGNSWTEVDHGDAGAEPINILVGPHDEIHLFAWPGVAGQLHHIESTDLGKTFTDQIIPGQWTTEQGYSGSGTNALGDIVFFQSGDDVPGEFLWTYYSHITKQWQFHTTQFDFRYTYAFFFPGLNNDLTMVAERDVKREEVGYQVSPDFDYVFDAIRYFHIADVNNPSATFSMVQAVQPTTPQNVEDSDITYLTDAYIDTQGRTHILYNNLYDGHSVIHHVIIDNGQVVKNVQQNVNFAAKARIFQDAQGHFYIIAMDQSGNSLNIYPGTASDTDGTQLANPVQLNISQFPGCTNYDFCHEPTLTLPRNGNALGDYIDGTYGNYTQEIYFRIQLRGSATSLVPTTTQSAQALSTSSPALQAFVIDERKQSWPAHA